MFFFLTTVSFHLLLIRDRLSDANWHIGPYGRTPIKAKYRPLHQNIYLMDYVTLSASLCALARELLEI